ncbi:serine/threonine protein kinase [Planococcus massiliensis]|uniref:Serine/threonine protein kinase n=1 Tax=Planococcus massiliensis TaxID=1499687 RepID=A0A098EJ06_9BACL|nr:phosphotransferase [Planococcus massiliensis]CEG21281.1 serine/threonine protein kinase [Planococcus massiliensis]
MNAKNIVKNFGFEVEEEPISIYPFSPVYRLESSDGEFIVKKTRSPIQKAHRLMAFTNTLYNQGINVVIPEKISTGNPLVIDDTTYVVYPFIKGESYKGQDIEIKEAGKLLGRIHSLSSAENEFQLDVYDVFDFTEDEVKESFIKIVENATLNNSVIDPELEMRLLRAVRQQKVLEKVGLPSVATPHDFKANNLIYVPNPYLIDPDNAGWIPRIFDLALVLFLFHNELATAPDQPFTKKQWEIFLEGYKENVTLTENEIHYWTQALEHVFLDDVMWLMSEGKEDWKNPVQRNLFSRLIQLLLNLEEYSLT